jgi:hypothetical protein
MKWFVQSRLGCWRGSHFLKVLGQQRSRMTGVAAYWRASLFVEDKPKFTTPCSQVQFVAT